MGPSSLSQLETSQCPQLNWMTVGAADAHLRHQPRLMRMFWLFAQLPCGHLTDALPSSVFANDLFNMLLDSVC